ncbi:MAG: 4Fe-4S binding protein [Candidatus Lokiarchaeota archaeon]|nr:4Fe-4S binding protein [Candidatus Lokiarchaeota archaeon]
MKSLSIKNHYITLIRRIVQITAFLLLNYYIIQWIFSINIYSLKGYASYFPILQTPRSVISNESGILELIFFQGVNGIFPFLLIGIFILTILFANRSFCGWICPMGTIQDALAIIPVKRKKFKEKTHQSLLKFKFLIAVLIIVIVLPLGLSIGSNVLFYNNYKANISLVADKPIGFFSLSEFIFVSFPELMIDIWANGNLTPLFSNPWIFISFMVYIFIIILSVYYPRFYCRYFCPVGAFCGMISGQSFLKISRSPVKCVGRYECGICEKVCPKQIRILDEPFEFFSGNGECNVCLKCMEKCPYGAIKFNFG